MPIDTRARASDSRPSIRTQRAAIELAYQAYESLFERLVITGDDAAEVSIFAASVHARGQAALAALQARVSDVSLSCEGSEAVAAYLKSLSTDDLDSQLTWLSMFPQLMRDVIREAATTVPTLSVEARKSVVVRAARSMMGSEWTVRTPRANVDLGQAA